MIVIAAMITTFDDQGDAYQQAFQELALNVLKDPGGPIRETEIFAHGDESHVASCVQLTVDPEMFPGDVLANVPVEGSRRVGEALNGGVKGAVGPFVVT